MPIQLFFSILLAFICKYSSLDYTYFLAGSINSKFANQESSLLETKENVNKLYGSNEPDSIRGRKGNDILKGYGSSDILSGGKGNDIIFGGSGVDILDGQQGSDKLYGDGDDDVLYALGDQRTPLEIFKDNLSNIDPFGIIPKVVSPDPDLLTGGDGKDLFFIREVLKEERFGFYPGQQYVIITDFQPKDNAEGDLIRLPGGTNNYITQSYDRDGDGSNDSTAILYTKNPNAQANITVKLVDVSGSKTLYIAEDDALVAIIPGVTAGNLTDSDFYIYGASTIP